MYSWICYLLSETTFVIKKIVVQKVKLIEFF